jgi:hypothetical protein
MKMDTNRLQEIIGKLEVVTTDGDLSTLTQDDIGVAYEWLTWALAQPADTGVTESAVENAFREWWDKRDTAKKLRSIEEMTAYQRIRAAFYAGAKFAVEPKEST